MRPADKRIWDKCGRDLRSIIKTFDPFLDPFKVLRESLMGIPQREPAIRGKTEK